MKEEIKHKIENLNKKIDFLSERSRKNKEENEKIQSEITLIKQDILKLIEQLKVEESIEEKIIEPKKEEIEVMEKQEIEKEIPIIKEERKTEYERKDFMKQSFFEKNFMLILFSTLLVIGLVWLFVYATNLTGIGREIRLYTGLAASIGLILFSFYELSSKNINIITMLLGYFIGLLVLLFGTIVAELFNMNFAAILSLGFVILGVYRIKTFNKSYYEISIILSSLMITFAYNYIDAPYIIIITYIMIITISIGYFIKDNFKVSSFITLFISSLSVTFVVMTLFIIDLNNYENVYLDVENLEQKYEDEIEKRITERIGYFDEKEYRKLIIERDYDYDNTKEYELYSKMDAIVYTYLKGEEQKINDENFNNRKEIDDKLIVIMPLLIMYSLIYYASVYKEKFNKHKNEYITLISAAYIFAFSYLYTIYKVLTTYEPLMYLLITVAMFFVLYAKGKENSYIKNLNYFIIFLTSIKVGEYYLEGVLDSNYLNILILILCLAIAKIENVSSLKVLSFYVIGKIIFNMDSSYIDYGLVGYIKQDPTIQSIIMIILLIIFNSILFKKEEGKLNYFESFYRQLYFLINTGIIITYSAILIDDISYIIKFDTNFINSIFVVVSLYFIYVFTVFEKVKNIYRKTFGFMESIYLLILINHFSKSFENYSYQNIYDFLIESLLLVYFFVNIYLIYEYLAKNKSIIMEWLKVEFNQMNIRNIKLILVIYTGWITANIINESGITNITGFIVNNVFLFIVLMFTIFNIRKIKIDTTFKDEEKISTSYLHNAVFWISLIVIFIYIFPRVDFIYKALTLIIIGAYGIYTYLNTNKKKHLD